MHISKTQLPVELWDSIIAGLPIIDQKTCLSVCRTWRKISITLLFDVVFLKLGTDAHDPFVDIDREFEGLSRSWEIMERITQDRTFALAVKKIVVLALSDHTVYARLCLSKALRAVPHLRSFNWFGSTQYNMTHDIAIALVDHCPGLSELILPASVVGEQSTYPPKALLALQNLQSLVFLGNELDEEDGFSRTGPEEFIDVEDLITGNTSSLRRLVLDGERTSRLPIRGFSSLTGLDIIMGPSDTVSLDLILHHAIHLQDLVIDGVTDDEIFLSLQRNHTALPALTSFKLVYIRDGCTEQQAISLSKFIQGRSTLRRLDLNFEDDWTFFAHIVPVIKGLTALNTLGLKVGGYLSVEDFTILAQYIPVDLDATRFEFNLNIAAFDSGPILPLMNRLAELQSLTFFCMRRSDGELWPLASDLATELKHLSLLSLDNSFWEVSREKLPGAVSLTPWSRHRSTFKLKESFRNDNAEWLLRYDRQYV